MVAQPKEDPQSGMFDIEIDDDDFEAAVQEWIELAPTRKTLGAIKRRIEEGKERHNIKGMEDGQRIRLGAYTFEAKARSGGGFAIPEWETVTISGLREIGTSLTVVE